MKIILFEQRDGFAKFVERKDIIIKFINIVLYNIRDHITTHYYIVYKEKTLSKILKTILHKK